MLFGLCALLHYWGVSGIEYFCLANTWSPTKGWSLVRSQGNAWAPDECWAHGVIWRRWAHGRIWHSGMSSTRLLDCMFELRSERLTENFFQRRIRALQQPSRDGTGNLLLHGVSKRKSDWGIVVAIAVQCLTLDWVSSPTRRAFWIMKMFWSAKRGIIL